MAMEGFEKRRRSSARCVHCGKKLPLRKGRPVRTCPTCGGEQEIDTEDPMLRRHREREGLGPRFRGAYMVGMVVGGILGLPLGGFFGATVYRDSDPAMVILLSIVYALGFAFMGVLFGFMTVAFWTRP